MAYEYGYNSDGARVWKRDVLNGQEYRYVCRIGCGGVPMRVYNRPTSGGSWASVEDYLPVGNALEYNWNGSRGMKVRRISRIGGRALPTALELPSDVSVVGVQYEACSDGDRTTSRDITYILMTTAPIADLRRLYKRKWSGIDLLWVVDDPTKFSFTAFRAGMQYRSDAFLFSLSAFRGSDSLERRVLGFSEKEYRSKTFILLLLPEPPTDGGFIVVPLLLKP